MACCSASFDRWARDFRLRLDLGLGVEATSGEATIDDFCGGFEDIDDFEEEEDLDCAGGGFKSVVVDG